MALVKPINIDAYIAGFPKDIQKILGQIRSTVKKAAPGAEETIKYAIPTYVLNGNLLSFAAFKKHIGIYPTPKGTKTFEKQISPYRKEKSTVQFPLDKPMPLGLLSDLVKHRVKETMAKSKLKKI